MSIKMIVTDLDDTLLRKDKTISERTISALKKCREKNVKTVYATGRGSSSKIFAPSELFDGFVQMNGASAFIGDLPVYNKLIPINDVRELLIAADNAGIQIAVESNGRDYANFNVTEKWSYVDNYETADFKNLNVDAQRLYAITQTPKAIALIKKYLCNSLHLYVGRDGLAIITHEEAVKSKAVDALADYWNIRKNEIVAFGDDMNDINLLEHCAIGVAMGNALDEVKAVADYICDGNDNDGVAKWLEENVL